MRCIAWRRVLLGIVALCLGISFAGAAQVLVVNERTGYRFDIASDHVVSSTSFSSTPGAVEMDAEGNQWELDEVHLRHRTLAGNLSLEIELNAARIEAPAKLRLDPYDGSAWVADRRSLHHFGTDGRLKAQMLLPEGLTDFAVALDQSVWLLGDKTLRQYAFDSRGEAMLRSSLDLPANVSGARLLVDAIRKLAWLADAQGIWRLDASGQDAPKRIVLNQTATETRLDPRDGDLFVLGDSALLKLNGRGVTSTLITFSGNNISKPSHLSVDSKDRQVWISHAFGITRIDLTTKKRALISLPNKAPVSMLVSRAFSVDPHIQLLEPTNGATLTSTSSVSLGLDARCATEPCPMPSEYFSTYRIDATLGDQPLDGFAIDAESRRASRVLNGLPANDGRLSLFAQAHDGLGHSSNRVGRTLPAQPISANPGTASASNTGATDGSSTDSAAAEKQNDTSSEGNTSTASTTPAATPPVASPLKPAASTPSAVAASAGSWLKDLPQTFEANRGQHDASVRFQSRGRGYRLFLSEGEAVLALRKPHGKAGNSVNPGNDDPSAVRSLAQFPNGSHDVLHKRFPGANPKPAVSGEDLQETRSHYFVGKDPSQWRLDVPHYAKVRYHDVYPGIDQIYYSKEGKLEYDWIVAPGAEPRRIVERFQGAKKLSLSTEGDLLIDLPSGQVQQHKPIAYQMHGNEKSAVEARYVISANNQISFALGAFDKSLPLVIDPMLTYATYIESGAKAVAVDSTGNAYLLGNGVVTKINATATSEIYRAYFDSLNGLTQLNALAINSAGEVFVAGSTNAPTIPVTANAYQPAQKGSGYNGFVFKLNAAGNALVYSTYLSGSPVSADSREGNTAIAIDSTGNAYVAGISGESDFPTTTNAFQKVKLSSGNAPYVAKLDATGSSLLYSTFLGGSADDQITSIAVDSAGNAYVGGIAKSADFPVTAGALRTARGGVSDGFVVKLNPSGSSLVYSTLLGGALPVGSTVRGAADGVLGIALDSSGNAYATGYTNSTDFPVANAFQSALNTSSNRYDSTGLYYSTNAFLTKLNTDGSGVVYSTFIGGSGCSYCTSFSPVYDKDQDVANAVAVDASGNATTVGYSYSDDFPSRNVATAALFRANARVAFISQFDPNGRLAYSMPLAISELGGSVATGVAMGTDGSAYASGSAGYSDTVVTTPGAIEAKPSSSAGPLGGSFVQKISQSGQLNVQIATSPNPSTAGQADNVIINVSGGAAGLSGKWSWCDGDVCQDMPFSGSNNNTTSVSQQFSVGTHVLTARYGGDGINPPATSPTWVHVVNDATTQNSTPQISLVLTTPTTVLAAGQNTTLTATLTGTSSCQPTSGSVDFLDGDKAIAAAALTQNAGGRVMAGAKFANIGTHYLRARYNGSNCASVSYSAPVNIVVDGLAPVVGIAAPHQNARFIAGSNIAIAVNASSPAGRAIAGVAIYAQAEGGNGQTQLGPVLTAAPYIFVWKTPINGTSGIGVPAGTYLIKASATDSGGETTMSTPVRIVVGAETSVGESITFLHTDIAGSPIGASDETGNIVWKEGYKPYGERLQNASSASSNRQFFHDKAADAESGLSYFGARYYDPVIGRFMGVDPKGFTEANLQSFNRYAYGNNNPYRYIDPDGKFAIPVAAVAGLGVLAAGGAYIANCPGCRSSLATGGRWLRGFAEGAIDGARNAWNSIFNEADQNTGQQGDHGAATTEGEGCIYCVDGANTQSGRDYIGSTDNLDQRKRDVSDGRNRDEAKIIDTYPKGNREARRIKEQKAINDRGGVDELDNKRNEVAPKYWDEKGISGP